MAIRKYKTKDGKIRYQAQLWADRKFCKSKSFLRKIDADRWLAEEKTFLSKPDLRPRDQNAWSCGAFFDEQFVINKRCSEGTRQDYRRLFHQYVRPRFDSESLNSIGANQWMDHLTTLVNQGLSHARANRLRTMLSSFYSFALKTEAASNNPILKIGEFEENQSMRETWSRSDVTRFFDHLALQSTPFSVLFRLAYETGMRMGELQALSRSAIQWELRRLIVCRTYSKHTKTIVETTKGRKTRVIPLSPPSLNRLKDLLESHHHELVFCQTDGKPFSQDQIRWAGRARQID